MITLIDFISINKEYHEVVGYTHALFSGCKCSIYNNRGNIIYLIRSDILLVNYGKMVTNNLDANECFQKHKTHILYHTCNFNHIKPFSQDAIEFFVNIIDTQYDIDDIFLLYYNEISNYENIIYIRQIVKNIFYNYNIFL